MLDLQSALLDLDEDVERLSRGIVLWGRSLRLWPSLVHTATVWRPSGSTWSRHKNRPEKIWTDALNTCGVLCLNRNGLPDWAAHLAS